jgi:hypothetical protein
MRGRTNANVGIELNGAIQEYEVASGETIEAGDFVELTNDNRSGIYQYIGNSTNNWNRIYNNVSCFEMSSNLYVVMSMSDYWKIYLIDISNGFVVLDTYITDVVYNDNYIEYGVTLGQACKISDTRFAVSLLSQLKAVGASNLYLFAVENNKLVLKNTLDISHGGTVATYNSQLLVIGISLENTKSYLYYYTVNYTSDKLSVDKSGSFTSSQVNSLACMNTSGKYCYIVCLTLTKINDGFYMLESLESPEASGYRGFWKFIISNGSFPSDITEVYSNSASSTAKIKSGSISMFDDWNFYIGGSYSPSSTNYTTPYVYSISGTDVTGFFNLGSVIYFYYAQAAYYMFFKVSYNKYLAFCIVKSGGSYNEKDCLCLFEYVSSTKTFNLLQQTLVKDLFGTSYTGDGKTVLAYIPIDDENGYVLSGGNNDNNGFMVTKLNFTNNIITSSNSVLVKSMSNVISGVAKQSGSAGDNILVYTPK